MKMILALSILFCAITLPALGELTDADLNQIRLIVKEEVKTEITNAEERINEHTNVKIDSLRIPVAWLIGILVAVIALIGIPLVVLTIMTFERLKAQIIAGDILVPNTVAFPRK